MSDQDDAGTARPHNPNARHPDESDSRYPFGPDWEVVNAAIQRHRDGDRAPVEIPVNHPFTVVVP